MRLGVDEVVKVDQRLKRSLRKGCRQVLARCRSTRGYSETWPTRNAVSETLFGRYRGKMPRRTYSFGRNPLQELQDLVGQNPGVG